MSVFSSLDALQNAIRSSLTGWDIPVATRSDNFSIWESPGKEKLIICLINTTLTGAERLKPQIRIFTEKALQAYQYANKNGLRFFFLVYCMRSANDLKFPNSIDPSDYIVSIESKLSTATGGRLDIRSMYDNLCSHNGESFFRLTSDMHNCTTLAQGSFIRIRDNSGSPSFEELENYLKFFDSCPYMSAAATGTRVVFQPSVLYQADSVPLELPNNLLVHGAPGTGKSHFLDEKICDFRKNCAIEEQRITFYEDYSYGQFVGDYLPIPCEDAVETVSLEYTGGSISGVVQNEHITYRFVPGPLAKFLAKCYIAKMKKETTKFILIVEELNRANAATVFGDFFQLLDREKGISIYEINPKTELAEYLRQTVSIAIGDELPEDAFERIRLPDNLYIWATMNSADQGVFPLDSAFKRRWAYIYRDIFEIDPASGREIPHTAVQTRACPFQTQSTEDRSALALPPRGNIHVKYNTPRHMRKGHLSSLFSVFSKHTVALFFFSIATEAKETPPCTVLSQ